MHDNTDNEMHLNTQAVTTTNVLETLHQIAHDWQCTALELDFEILHTLTYYGDDQIIFNPNDLSFMLDIIGSDQPHNLIQEHKILVFKKDKEQPSMNFSLVANKEFTKVYAVIKKGTIFEKALYTRDTFRDTANKKCLLMVYLLVHGVMD